MNQGKLLLSSAMLAGLFAAQPASAAISVSDDVVLYWNQVAAQTVLGSPATTTRPIAKPKRSLSRALTAWETQSPWRESQLIRRGTPRWR